MHQIRAFPSVATVCFNIINTVIYEDDAKLLKTDNYLTLMDPILRTLFTISRTTVLKNSPSLFKKIRLLLRKTILLPQKFSLQNTFPLPTNKNYVIMIIR